MRLPLLAAALAATPFAVAAAPPAPIPAQSGPVPAALPPATPGDQILVTAAREPVSALLSGVSASVIDLSTIRAVQLPQVTDYLRLVPGVAVSISGPLGELSEVRIRGAEARHTLVFVDGVSANDPASSSVFLFNTLPADGLTRIEVLRGPQSALWGSAALGGVISVTTPTPTTGRSLFVSGEGGSLGTYRATTAANLGNDIAALSGTASYVATDGIAISGKPGGVRNGFDNLVLSLKGVLHPTPDGELGAVVRYTDATSRFDDVGADGLPLDAHNATTNRALAVRAYADAHLASGALDLHTEASYLDTNNLNRVDGQFTNASAATRTRFVGQASGHVTTGDITHRLTGAVEYEEQVFTANDTIYGGGTNQRDRRNQTSGIGEYRLEWANRADASVSVRHDANSGFADTTTVRAAAAAQLGNGLNAHGSYGEGVSDPTFFDQFGFFPGSFVGNPKLKPEGSSGFDIGGGWRRKDASLDVTYFRTNLTNQITGTFDNTTFLAGVANAVQRSHRQGVEVAAEARPLAWLRASATYTYLDASNPVLATGIQLRAARRPEHSGSVTLTADRGPATLALTTAYVGDRGDKRFFGAPNYQSVPVTLGSYWLASVAGSLNVGHGVELTARVENAFDQHYQDVFGYRTPGLTAYGGLRTRFR